MKLTGNNLMSPHFYISTYLLFIYFCFVISQAESVMVENLQMSDGQEGIKAFLEKREPVWTHRTDCH